MAIIKKINTDIDIAKKYLYYILKQHTKEYVIDKYNIGTIKLLFDYFNGLEGNLDLNKGILLCGDVGSGKTILMRGFKDYTIKFRTNGFQFYYATEITSAVNLKGIKELDVFSHNKSGNKPTPITCYIDDILYRNETVKHYGTDINVIEQLISIRYDIYTRYKKLTHFSTNVYPGQMKEFYDKRTIDRLKEMCNVVQLTGDSRRK